MPTMAEDFEAERSRLTVLAARILDDHAEAQDIVQQAWLRWVGADAASIESLPAWLTTVTTRLCLDRLRARRAVPVAEVEDLDDAVTADDPAETLALSDAVGVALHVVLARLSPAERVAFVLHDSFGFEFATIAAILDTTPAAARKLASRARARLRQPAPEDALADWEIVDAFMAAARGGDLARLMRLLAPDVVVTADDAAIGLGTPTRIEGRDAVSAFFDGAARAAFPVYVGQRPASAWFQHGAARVVFDFDLADGIVRALTFRADPSVLARVRRRDGARPRD